jgi:hypothetical protein
LELLIKFTLWLYVEIAHAENLRDESCKKYKFWFGFKEGDLALASFRPLKNLPFKNSGLIPAEQAHQPPDGYRTEFGLKTKIGTGIGATVSQFLQICEEVRPFAMY